MTGRSTGPPPAAKQTGSPPPVRAATLYEIAAEYAKAQGDEERAELARSLASIDSLEAIETIGLLFVRARTYAEKLELVGALSDSHAESSLDAKLMVLRSALAPVQARPVRSAALDVASQLDDPRAVELVRRAADHDADKQIREQAKAVLPDE